LTDGNFYRNWKGESTMFAPNRPVKAVFAWSAHAAILSLLAIPAFASPTVTVSSGKLAGTTDQGVEAYLGIPYAAPPIGDRRFSPPQPVTQWKSVRDASSFGANCIQPITDGIAGGFAPWTAEYTIAGPTSEDCLFLNVWTPKAESNAKHPVLVWIHGGGFVSGSGSVAVYQGAQFAKKGIVVVTINYRLGALGFLAAPALGDHPGNYGVLDMIAALKWVQANIAAFGGDPSKVTIAGQSAGSAAVHALVASPQARGLFGNTIAESGSGLMPLGRPYDAAKTDGAAYMAQRGVKDLAGLRALPASAFVASIPSTSAPAPKAPSPALRFSPVVDGTIITDDPTDGSDVPMLTGLVADEGSAMSPNYGKATIDSFTADAARVFGDDSSQLLSLYPVSDPGAVGSTSIQLKRDFGQAGTWIWAVNRAKTEKAPVYMYFFRHVEPSPDSDRYGAFHSSEIPYVFGNLNKGKRDFNDIDHKVSQTMMTYWINFISTGNPNGSTLSHWPALEVNSPQILEIGDGASIKPLLTSQKRDFYAKEISKGIQPSLF
jgi:para-nitrobenzyl esterase